MFLNTFFKKIDWWLFCPRKRTFFREILNLNLPQSLINDFKNYFYWLTLKSVGQNFIYLRGTKFPLRFPFDFSCRNVLFLALANKPIIFELQAYLKIFNGQNMVKKRQKECEKGLFCQSPILASMLDISEQSSQVPRFSLSY